MAEFNPGNDEDKAYLAGALVAYALGLKAETILSAERGTPVNARARHIAMYLAYAACGMSLARVARAFGRDRSTVAHGCRLVEDYREDPDFDLWIEQLSQGLRSVAMLSAGEVEA
ncbi:MAG: helix-turn-helix domain-containing protein [Hyphomonas sp.]